MISVHHLSYWKRGIDPVEPNMKRPWLLGDKKLKGLKLKPVCDGTRITEIRNIMTLSVMRIVVSWSESPKLFVNALFLNFDDGFFKPQKGQLSIEPDISFLQFGQRSDVLTFEGAISRFVMLGHQKETGNYYLSIPILSQTLLI